MSLPCLKFSTVLFLFVVNITFLPSAHAWPRRDFDRDDRKADDVLEQRSRASAQIPGLRYPSTQKPRHGRLDLVSRSETTVVTDAVNGLSGIRQARTGFAHPVRWMKLMRGFDGDNCWHQGLDIASHGPIAGVGQPIYSIVKSTVTFIGTPEMNPAKYGRRDRRWGMEKRGGVEIPRRVKIAGYPMLYPFTRGLGSAKTGVFVVTKAMHPQIQDHSVRYMHMAAVRPGLQVGDLLEAGQEIGVMGSTAIMESQPHLHLDIETPSGRRLDPAHLLGVGHIVGGRCRSIHKRALAAQGQRSRARRASHRH